MAAYLRGLDAVAAYLAAKGETVETRRMGIAVPASFGERFRPGAVDIVWQAKPGLVQLYLVLPFDVPEDRRAAVGLSFLGINAELPAGGFLLTPLPAFSVALFLNHDGSLSSAVLDRAIGACREAAARHVGAIADTVLPRSRPAPPAVNVGAVRVAFSPEDRARLAPVVEHEWPLFAARMGGPLHVYERTQPWFKRHRVLDVQSPAPMPAVGVHIVITPAGELRVLRGHLETLVQMAKDDPPEGLEREEMSLAYADICGQWTNDAEYGELRIEKFDDIPWRPQLTPAEQAQARELRLRLAGDVHAPRIVKTERGFSVRSWVVASRRLIYRELHVPPSGQMLRDERVWAEGIGVFPGRVWGMVGGRLVPVG